MASGQDTPVNMFYFGLFVLSNRRENTDKKIIVRFAVHDHWVGWGWGMGGGVSELEYTEGSMELDLFGHHCFKLYIKLNSF